MLYTFTDGSTVTVESVEELAQVRALFDTDTPIQETVPVPVHQEVETATITVTRQGHDYEVVIDEDLRGKFASWLRGKVGREHAGISIEDALVSGVYVPMALRKRMSKNKVPADMGEKPNVVNGNSVDFRKASPALWERVAELGVGEKVRFASLTKSDLHRTGRKVGWELTWKEGKTWACSHPDVEGKFEMVNVNRAYAKKHNVDVDRSFTRVA